jgi:hypothetical protein
MNKVFKTKNSSSGDTTAYYVDGSSTQLDFSLIEREIKSGIIKPHYRLHWLNPDETERKLLPEQDIISGGSFSENYQNGQRRSLSVTLFNETKQYTPSINGLWINSKFSYDLGWEMTNGDIIWFQKGVYVVTNITPSHEPGLNNVSLEMSDKFSIFESGKGVLETTYTIPTGMEIETILNSILQFQGGDGNVLDNQPMIYNSAFKGKKTQTTITKEAGSNFGEIISELCTQLNAEYFYDVCGCLNIVPINDVTDDIDKPIIDSIYEEQGDFGSNNLTLDFNNIVNRVIVTGGNSDSKTYRAVAVNDDPSSPLCYQRIGYRTADPIDDSNITSDILAQDRADYELRSKLILNSSASTNIMLNPFYIVNNIIEITDSFYGFEQEKFLIQSISYNLDYSGTMSITSSNTRNLPFTTTRR